MSGATSAVLLGTMAVGTGMQAIGAYNQSKANKSAYAYQAQVNANNAKIAEWQAQDALQRGAKTEQRQRLQTAQLKSSQRARLAANGVALDEGSPLSILQDTDYMGEMDARTIQSNAAREAWGYRNQAAGYASDSAMLRSRSDAESPLLAGTSSLLTGAGSVAASWYRFGQAGGGGGRNLSASIQNDGMLA